MGKDISNLTDILDEISNSAEGSNIKVGEVLKAFNHRGHGPLLLTPALISIMPTGAIPGVPGICALLIIMFSIQIIMGQKTPWIPKALAKKSINKKKFERAQSTIRPYTKKIDALLKPRLHFLVTHFATRLIAVLCIGLALLMFPLGFIPGAVAAPASAILFLSLGITARDGVFTSIGLVITLAAAIGSYYWLSKL